MAMELVRVRSRITDETWQRCGAREFVSALAISGAARSLIEAVGRRCHEVAQEYWQEPGAMAAL
jgi:hypothetical protein